MKKIFTLIGALIAFTSTMSAATVDDLAPMKHSYVLVFDEYTADGTGSRTKGAVFGDSHFLDVTGGSVNNGGKGSVDLATMTYGNGASPLEYLEGNITPEEIAALQAKYADYGTHINSLRLKNTQDVIACKPTAGSVLYVFGQGNNKSGKDCRIPKFSKTADLAEGLNDAPTADWGKMNIYVYKFVVPADFDGNIPLYIGSYNGDSFFSYIIVEANEAEGTPSVKVGQQTYEGGLWFKEVTVTPGLAYGLPTDVHYTTDGTEPTAASEKYTAPIKCYKETTLKFQAFMNGMAIPDANNEAGVSFSFDAPSIDADGANVTITSPYEGAKNFYTLNGGEAQEGSSFTLTESATVAAYSQIVNGSYATFTTKTTTKDVYVLNPIKEKKTITVSGNAVIDEEATANSTTGEVYKIENGAITADKADFFVKNLTFKALANNSNDAQYQVPAGQEAYIQMSNTNITFQVAEGDSVTVKVICSKNACKNIDAEDAEDGSQVNDRKCVINLSGTNYTHKELQDVTYKDAAGNDSIVNEFAEAADLKLFENANIIEFGLTGGIYTFQKYSGTGNIMISSIEITPAAPETEPETLDLIDRFTNCWNGEESNTHNADGSITYNAVQWGGLAAWIGGEDWSEYNQIVFEFAEPTTFATQVFMQYADGTETKAWVNAGAAKAECTLEAGKVAVNQAALQCAEAGTLTITKIYLTKGSSGIQTVQVVNVKNGAIYNLAGQKVDANYKGVVIMNGKKVVLK